MVNDLSKVAKVIKDMEKIYPQYKEKPDEGYNEELCVRIQNNDKEAETELIVRNRTLAIDILSKYYFGDNVEDAYLSILYSFIKAANRWDREKGKFVTYAYWWGRNAIERDIKATENPVSLPYYLQNKIYELNKIIAVKHTNHENDTSTKELAEMLGITEDVLKNLLPFSNELESLDKVLTYNNDLKGRQSEENMYRFVEIDTDIAEKTEQKIFVDQILGVAKNILTENEYMVLVLRNGIETGYPLSLKETSEALKVIYNKSMTAERVRQIEGKALRKLRHSRILYKDIKEQYPGLLHERRKYLK